MTCAHCGRIAVDGRCLPCDLAEDDCPCDPLPHAFVPDPVNPDRCDDCFAFKEAAQHV